MEFTLNIFNFRSTENVIELKLEDALKGLYIFKKNSRLLKYIKITDNDLEPLTSYLTTTNEHSHQSNLTFRIGEEKCVSFQHKKINLQLYPIALT